MRIREVDEKMIHRVSPISKDNKKMSLLISSSACIPLFDIEKRKVFRQLVGHTGVIRDVISDINGALSLTCSEDNSAKCWDLRVFKPAVTLEGHKGVVTTGSIANSDSSTLCFTGATDKCIKVWDLRNNKPLYELATGCNVPIRLSWHEKTSTLTCLSGNVLENQHLDEDGWPSQGRIAKAKNHWRGVPWNLGGHALISYIFKG